MKPPVATPDTIPAETKLSERLAGLSLEKLALLEVLMRREKSSAAAAKAPAAIPRRPGNGPGGGRFPLSFAQERLWFIDRFEPGNALYNMPSVLRFQELDVPALEAALSEIVRRHETLRTRFEEEGGVPVQAVEPPRPFQIPVIDLSALPAGLREEEERCLRQEEAERPFDLSLAPLLRVVVFRSGEEDHQVAATVHHIVSDGWSTGILMREVGIFYEAAREGRPAALPELPIQYGDYAHWQRRQAEEGALDRQMEHWRRQLAGLPAVLELPADRPRPPVLSHNGAAASRILPPPLADGLRALSRNGRLTFFTTVLAAFHAFLGRLCGVEDVAVGVPVGSRKLLATEGLIGVFVKTLVLRGDLSGDPPFLDLLERTRDTVAEAHANDEVPFERIVAELAPERSLAHSPLFQVMLSFPAGMGAAAEPRDGEPVAEAVGVRMSTALFDLSLSVQDSWDGGLGLHCEYRTALFDATTVARWLGHLERLASAAVADPSLPFSELPLLAPAEIHQLTAEWNDTAAGFERETAVHELLARQAARTPEAAAVTFEGQSLSYGELARRANRLAHRLIALGVRPETRVAVCLERSLDLVATVWSVLAAGGAYVPLDPNHPRERREYVLRDSGAAVLVTEERLAADLAPEVGTAVVFLDRGLLGGEETGRQSEERPHVPFDAAHPAYVIYTSGSTGRPKGVVVPHRALANFLASMRRRPGLAAEDVLLAVTTLAFDIAGLELLLPLTVGARVVVAPGEAVVDGVRLAALLREAGATVLQATPATWRLLLEAGWEGQPGLRLLCGGEALPRDLAERLLASDGPGGEPELWNLYGPTETTVWSTVERVRRWTGSQSAMPATVPIGKPIANTRLRVLDRWSRQAPIGVAGELWIGGDGLARGYLARPALTAERFVPDPLAGEPGARLYRTGDLVRRRPDGMLESLGRIDHQVKVRGVRVELGEIDAALTGCPGVRQAAVVAPADPNGGRRLVACIVPEGTQEPDPGELRIELLQRLPEGVVPSAFLILPELPLTPNGKVDRQALLAAAGKEPADGSTASGPESAPRTPVQTILAEMWGELLGRGGFGGIGVGEDFFSLGGHSLLAMRLMSRILAVFGLELPLRTLFEGPTIAALAARIEVGIAGGGQGRTAPPLRPVPRHPELPEMPLSFAQERLWFLDRLYPGSSAYNMPQAVRVSGAIAPAALACAIEEVQRRHEALRTTFAESAAGGGRPVQRIAPEPLAHLVRVNLRGLPPGLREAEAERQVRADAARPFDLERGPLLRALLLETGEDEAILLLSLHHIVSDGWSHGILVSEAAALYEAFAADRPSRLAELPVQYADYAAWQRGWLSGEVLAAELEHWRQRLAGSPPAFELPADRPRPALWSGAGDSRSFMLGPEVSAALAALARREGATLFMLLLAAWHALLARHTGRLDGVIGSPIAGRNRLETEGLIGFFVNTLALRLTVDGPDPVFRALLRAARETALEAYAHQELPFERLVEELHPERSLSRTPLFQGMFALQNAPEGDLRLSGTTLSLLPGDTRETKFDFSLSLFEVGDGAERRLACSLGYATDLFDATTIERVLARFETLLAGIAADPGRLLSEMPLLPQAERHQLLAEWNDTGLVAPAQTVGLHQLVERQAERAPDAVALLFEEERVTYGELDRWGDRIAGRLRQAGTGLGDFIAIFAERSPLLIAMALGVLKAGAAYVALDPEHPPARLAAVLEDAGVRRVVVQEDLRERLPDSSLLLFSPSPGGRECGWERGPGGEGLLPAYLVYTSGSTGRPKGILAHHRGVAGYLSWVIDHYNLTAYDTVLQLAPMTFDASVRDIFAPLTVGARLVLVPQDAVRDPAVLRSRIAEHGVTCLLSTVPSVLRLLTEKPVENSSVRLVLAAGERLYGSDAAAVRRAFGPNALLFNQYGASECTMSSTFQLASVDDGPVPAGRPIDSARVVVLDRWGGLAPLGAPGEVAIGGPWTSYGYLGQPDRTAESFAPDPLGGTGERLYRTGDLGRLSHDGRLEYLGRLDGQVKVRGIRVETGEVEAVVASHPAVAQAAVLLRMAGGGDRLVAYVVPRDGAALSGLGAWLRERLPEALVPAAFVPLTALPLTPHGKVDREALSRIEPEERWGLGGYVAPRTPVEEVLAGIWAEVLGLEEGRVGTNDNFFELSGHSLLAAQVVHRIRLAFGVELPLRRLFDRATLSDLAAEIEAAGRPGVGGRPQGGVAGMAGPIERVPRDGRPMPASFNQEWVWHLQGGPVSNLVNLSFAFRLQGPLVLWAFRRAVDEMVRRHELLRSTFRESGGEVFLVAHTDPAETGIPLTAVDLLALPAEKRPAVVQALARELAREFFDLRRLPLTLLLLLPVGEEDHVLLVTQHHIIGDGWSIEVFGHELAVLHDAFVRGEPSPLPELPIQFADYTAWQRRTAGGEGGQVAWWRQYLADPPVPVGPPLDRPGATYGPKTHMRHVVLSAELLRRLRQVARDSGCSLAMALFAGTYALLHRYTGAEDIVLGATFATRNRPEMFGLLGLLMNSVPLRARLSGAPSFRELMQRVRDSVLDAYAHQDVSFPRLLMELGVEKKASRTLLFRVLFNLLDFPSAGDGQEDKEKAGPRLTAQSFSIVEKVAKYDIGILLTERNGVMQVDFVGAADLLDAESIGDIAQDYGALLSAAAENPDASLGEIPPALLHPRAPR